MAGFKGRSGGARAGSGGVRPGAGRKPNPNRAGSHKESPVQITDDDADTFVYVIYEVDDPSVVKVGVATDIVKRLSTMQVGTWRALKIAHAIKAPSKSAAHAIERQVHQALAPLHVRGEWFRVSPNRAANEVDIACDSLRGAFSAISKVTSI